LDLRDVSAREEAEFDEAAFVSSRLEHAETEARAAAQAVFLHTSWRSGGTWIWSRCRASSRVCGFYEPLHEQAARFSRRTVSSLRPGSWQSNHSETAPYFEEYRTLIPPSGRGVPGYREDFAFDNFFRAPDDPADLALETYLAGLLASPPARNKLPVLKFCRSLGRVGWLENLFPKVMHLVVLRDPLAQFNSIQRLLEQQRNRYFTLAPMLVLARNAHHPQVRAAAATLGVSLPALFSTDMDYAVETCWRHIRRLSLAEQYRGFLAFWTLCAVAALESEARVIDIDSMGTDPAHRLAAEAMIRAQIGETVKLVPRTPPPAGARPPPPGLSEAHAAALAFLHANRNRLTAPRHALISAKLESHAGAKGAPLVAGWRSPIPPAPLSRRRMVQRCGTGLAVLLARAIQPLRRLHGVVAWRRANER
jgi:hypothetical protein